MNVYEDLDYWVVWYLIDMCNLCFEWKKKERDKDLKESKNVLFVFFKLVYEWWVIDFCINGFDFFFY